MLTLQDLQIRSFLAARDDIGIALDPLGIGVDLERRPVERDRLGAGLGIGRIENRLSSLDYLDKHCSKMML